MTDKMEEQYGRIDLLRDVCAVSYKALQKAKPLVKEGGRLVDVADAVESFIKEAGYGIAFPLNLSQGAEAAHYTPKSNDGRLFGREVVKIDIGAEREGILGDCALTVDLTGENGELVDASRAALENAIASIKAGAKIGEIGGEIERTLASAGFNPIVNLGGHGVRRNDLHSDPFIPNFDNGDDTELEEGMIVAIEPFATTGEGYVVSGESSEIFSFMAEAAVRMPGARKLFAEITSKYPHNPFALRWNRSLFDSDFALYAAAGELLRAGAIDAHPVLVESSGGIVSQYEAMVAVEKGGCELLTK